MTIKAQKRIRSKLTIKTWKRLSRTAKFIRKNISYKLGLRLQDIVYDLYPA